MTDRVYGSFTVVEDRGTDALGTVHLAKGPGGVTAVLHVLDERFATSAASAVLRETLARSQMLSHPNVIAIRGFSDGRDGVPWIAEEDIGGVTLASLIDMNVKLLWTSAAMVLHEVTAAISYAIRQGVIHGSLGPADVIMAQDGRVKVRGFGLARLLDESLERGIPRMVTPREDLRALGRLAHDMVVGAAFGKMEPEDLERDLDGLGLPDGYREILRVASTTVSSELQSTQQVLAHVRALLAEAGLSDVAEGLGRTFEELSFFFLVAGGNKPSAPTTPSAPGTAPPVAASRAPESPGRGAVPAGASRPVATARAPIATPAPGPSSEGSSSHLFEPDASDVGGASTVVLKAPGLLNDLLEDPVSVDAPTVVGVPPRSADPEAAAPAGGDGEPKDPTVWLDGDAKPHAEGEDENDEIAATRLESTGRRLVGAEFERVASGTSPLIWGVVALLIVGLVVVAVVVFQAVRNNKAADDGSEEAIAATLGTTGADAAGAATPVADPSLPGPNADAGAATATPAVKKPEVPVTPERDPVAARAEKEALGFLEVGKPVAARDILVAAREKVPGDAGLAVLVARTLIATKSWDEAARTLEAAVKLDRERVDTYVLIGEVELARERPAEAVDALRHVLDSKGDDADFLLTLGRALAAKGDHEAVTPILLQALQVRPDFPEAQLLLGRNYEQLRDGARAIEAYKAAAVDRTLAEEALLRVVDLMQRRGLLREALALVQERLSKDPEFPLLYQVLGDVHYREHRFDEARKALERYIELVPDAVDARIVLGNVLSHQRDTKGAAALYRQALDLAPTDGRAAHNLGMALLSQGDPAGAEAVFVGAIDGGTAVWQTRCELGRMRQRAGKLADAKALYKSALEKKPDHPWLRQMVALPMDSGQAEILMTRLCDDREMVEASLGRGGQ